MDSPAARAGSHQPRHRLRVTASRTTLTAALNSATKIVKLLEEFDEDPDLVKVFQAMHGTTKLRWDDFCYGPRDYGRLLNRLTAGRPGHPIAVHGQVRTISTDKTGANHVLREHGRARMTEPPHRWVPIVVRTPHRSLLAADETERWLAFGNWEHWSSSSGYRELRMWADAPWHLTSWTEHRDHPKQ